MKPTVETQTALVLWLARMNDSQTLPVFKTAVDNRTKRHCRIGRITLKEQAR